MLAEQRWLREEMKALKDYFTGRFGPQLARSIRDEHWKAARR
jgi:hypothetical protein